MPIKKQSMHSTILPVIYIAANNHCPFSNNLKASPVKVENVLKPPQTPVIKNKAHGADIFSFNAIPSMTPNRIHASAFATRVAHGKCND